MYVKLFIVNVKLFVVNVNKRLSPFCLEQHINIVNRVKLQIFWFVYRYLKVLYLKTMFDSRTECFNTIYIS